MTTFEFKMTPRAYYAGWRVLQRQQLRLQWVFCALCAVLAVAGILLYFLLQHVEETAILPALSGIVAAMAVLLPWVRRSSVLREFGNSPTLTQPFTLRLEEQALQVWSKFEPCLGRGSPTLRRPRIILFSSGATEWGCL